VLGKNAPQEPAVFRQRMHIAFLPQLFDQPRRALVSVNNRVTVPAGRSTRTGLNHPPGKIVRPALLSRPASGHSAGPVFANDP
jgi:hypothetical protein